MFVLGKLNYRINRHEKDIFNFCFTSSVNRVLQIVSTCSIWCILFHLFSLFFFFTFIWFEPIRTMLHFFFVFFSLLLLICCIVICVSHTCYSECVKLNKYVRCTSVRCASSAFVYVCLCAFGCWVRKSSQTYEEYLLLSFFPDRLLVFFFHLLFSVSVNVSVV